MPKLAKYTLTWSRTHDRYELHDGASIVPIVITAWLAWLNEHRSFAFMGQSGRLSMVKERRRAEDGYWYAYRRQGGDVLKRYGGRSETLTFARLEELSRALSEQNQPAFVPQHGTPTHETHPQKHGMTLPLLTPKLQPPRLHRSLVTRGRLLAQLDAGRERKLTLLSAPAGFGKTTLVRQWLQHIADFNDPQLPPPRVAWLALDGSDNDPLRFWRYVITACCAFGPEVGAHSLAPLELPLTMKSPLDMILTLFLNELTQISCESILILEDYHLITTPQIHEAISMLLEHLPPQLHLVLMSRTQPRLPLARLAAAGELTEIEASDLRFSDAETAAFLDQATALSLQPGEIALVEAHLEGWAAGLRLLALALEGRTRDAIGSILAHVIAGQRSIGDYFIAEVLHHQPEPLHLFLLQTSFLVRLTASLCDNVTGRNDSQTMLEALNQANLFIEPLDELGLWYRYHALFAATMQGVARRRLGDDAVRDALERAGRWYEAHAFTAEAIEAAFAADDPWHAADLIESVARHQFSIEKSESHGPQEFYTLQNWIVRLPQPVLDKRPLLNLTLAAAILFTVIADMRPLTGSVSSELERLLARAEQGFRATGESDQLGLVFTFRSLVVRERGGIATAVQWARAALEALPPAERNWRSVCIGTVAMGEHTNGRLRDATELLGEALVLCEQGGNQQFARAASAMLGWNLVEQNEPQRATALFRQTLAEAQAIGDLEDIANTRYGLAEIALCEHDLETAWSQASEVVKESRHDPHQDYYVHAALILVRVEQARGQSEAALTRCDTLLAQIGVTSLPADKQVIARIAYEQTRIALATGDIAAVRRWRDTRPIDLELPRAHYDREGLLLARLFVAQGDPEAAAHLLEPLLVAAEADGRGRVALELHVALALAFAAVGRSHDARHTLAAAIANAWPANAQHVLISEGEALAPLLRATLPILHDKSLLAFARIILHHLEPTGTSLLSPQERRVLRLIAAGRTNTAIATDLIISVNTVKVHVKNIYRKLNVTSRLEAASTARDLSLL